MRSLIRLIVYPMLRHRAGRWALTIILLGVGGLCLVAAPQMAENQQLGAWAAGGLFVVLGVVLLFLTIRLDLQQRKAAHVKDSAVARVAELKASGKLLPIPALPAPSKQLSPADAARVAGYAERMEALPWAQKPMVPPAEVASVFNTAVARTRRVRGDWSQLGEPIDTFVGLPKPLCYVGAAEVMYRLSYMRFRLYAPVGLRQGLRFIAYAQYTDPEQPDALVIRVKLLAGGGTKSWLALADQTLDLLRRVAPNHPRLPDAELVLHVQKGEYEAALTCADRIIAQPPSPEESYLAQANRAQLLEALKRHDEAIAAYQQALALDPSDPWVWHNLSLIYEDQGRYQEALDCNSRALSIMDFALARQVRERILAKMAAPGQL